MSRKTQRCYEHLFNCIRTEIVHLKPATVVTDYEVAMRNALAKIFPTAQLVSCWFHFCQAVKRHGSQLGGFLLAARASSECSKIYYQLMCLPLLPAEHIMPTYTAIKLEAQVMGNTFDLFLDYFEKQWLRKVNN